jgi:hypothetical protein
MESKLLNLETLLALKEATPLITVPSYEAAKAVVKALAMYSAGNTAQKDCHGVAYWYCPLADLLKLIELPVEFSAHAAGKLCREFQLVMNRENDGYHVGWSQTQLDILSKNIK